MLLFVMVILIIIIFILIGDGVGIVTDITLLTILFLDLEDQVVAMAITLMVNKLSFTLHHPIR